MSQANDGTGPVIVYVVIYDEADEPSEVCGVFTNRKAAELFIGDAGVMYIATCKVDEGITDD